MKKLSFLAAIAMIAFTSNAFAQDQATASVATSATIVSPISISGDVNLSFGNIIGAAGSVTVAPNNDRSSVGDLLITDEEGTVSAASFTVSGQAGYIYSITLPAAEFTVSNGGDTPATMTVGTFLSAASGAEATTGTLATDGTETVTVGATLTVDTGQATGVYTNDTDMAVTVNYN